MLHKQVFANGETKYQIIMSSLFDILSMGAVNPADGTLQDFP